MPVDWIGYGYGVLVATGGIIGYIKAGSIVSFIAGLFFGLLACVGAFQMSQNPRNVWISLAPLTDCDCEPSDNHLQPFPGQSRWLPGTYGILTTVMGVRFLSSWKVMPAGFMAGASFLMFLRICFLRLQKKTS
ncbi:hypothetical protein AOLI_G00046090 [Acnodon oligacanthus]